jgi:hypothetical protein
MRTRLPAVLRRLLPCAVATLLACPGSSSAEPPPVTLRPLATAPRVGAAGAGGARADDPRARRLGEGVARTRARALAQDAARA